MYLYIYIAAHNTAVVKNVIGFGFDFDFMFYVTTGAYKTKNYNYKKLTLGKR